MIFLVSTIVKCGLGVKRVMTELSLQVDLLGKNGLDISNLQQKSKEILQTKWVKHAI